MAPGQIIASDHINDVKDRSVQRYADSGTRTTQNPTPADGDMSFLDDTGDVYVFTGSVWRRWMPATGGNFTGNVSLSAGAIDTVLSDFQAIVRNPNTGVLERYNVNQDSVPLSGGNSGDARLDAAAQMVTISFNVAGDALSNPIGLIPNPYRPLREYNVQGVVFGSGGVGRSEVVPVRFLANGEMRFSGGDTLPAAATLRASVAYPWVG